MNIRLIEALEGDFTTSEFDHLSLKVNNATRWNSLYLIIKRAIKLKDQIDLFCIREADYIHGLVSTKRAVTAKEKEKLLKNDKLDQAD
jgi:hypothetical protein